MCICKTPVTDKKRVACILIFASQYIYKFLKRCPYFRRPVFIRGWERGKHYDKVSLP